MRRVVIPVALMLAAGPAFADKWGSPETETITSKNGLFTVTVTPDPIGGDTATALLLLKKGGTTVYERKAVNHEAPVDILVSDSGHVVTLNDWAHAGYDHALVIYDPKGELVVDRRLEELLTAEERGKIAHTWSSRWWIKRDGEVRFENAELVLPSVWGEELRWRLADGVRTNGGKVMAIPTDEERYTGYVTGKRRWKHVEISFGEADNEDGGVHCKISESESKCKPFGKTSRKASTTRHTVKEFGQTLEATTAFGTLLNTDWRGGLPEPQWGITVVFRDTDEKSHDKSYSYKILVAKRETRKEILSAVAALRKLAGL